MTEEYSNILLYTLPQLYACSSSLHIPLSFFRKTKKDRSRRFELLFRQFTAEQNCTITFTDKANLLVNSLYQKIHTASNARGNYITNLSKEVWPNLARSSQSQGLISTVT
jgi:hypothetical protein